MKNGALCAAPDAEAVALRTMAPAPTGSIAALRGRSVSPHLTRLGRAVFRSTRDGLFQPARFRELVEGDDGDQDQPDGDLLDVGVDVHQHQSVDQQADQNRADHRAEDRADAAEQAGPPITTEAMTLGNQDSTAVHNIGRLRIRAFPCAISTHRNSHRGDEIGPLPTQCEHCSGRGKPTDEATTGGMIGMSGIGAYVWSGRASQEGFVDLAVMVLHRCIRPLIEAVASGHHGYQRAYDLISGKASTGHMRHQIP